MPKHDQFRRVKSAEDYVELLSRALPHSAESETAILGAITLDNSLVYQAIELGLEPEDMYVRANYYCLKSMFSMAQTGREINPILLGEELKREGLLEQIGGITYLSELTYGLPHFTNVAHYVKVVKDKAHLRNLIKLCNLISATAFDEEDDAHIILTEAESSMLALTSEALRGSKLVRKKEFVRVSEDRAIFETKLDRTHRGLTSALATGIKPIDDLLEGGGLNPQNMYLIAAKPKAGKTSLALAIAYRIAKFFAEEYLALGFEQSVGVVSMEMRREALEYRLYSSHTGIPYDVLTRAGRLHGVNYEVAKAGLDGFFNILPLYITDAIFDIDEAWRAAERLVRGPAQAKLLIFDYLQLMSKAQRRAGKRALTSFDADKRTQEVTAISRDVKHMAQDLNVPIIGISSLSRLGELRESGQLDYDLEALLMLENPDWKPDMTVQERAILDAKKIWDINARMMYQRNGATGDIMLKFLREFMQFVTPEEYALMIRPKTIDETQHWQ